MSEMLRFMYKESERHMKSKENNLKQYVTSSSSNFNLSAPELFF